MLRTSLLALALIVGTVGCAGRQVPQHSGYKGKKPTPWTKPKVIELDDELTAKVESDLDYGQFKRAKWFALTLPGPGELTLDLETVPAGDADLDVAMEVLDPNYHVIVRADEESEDVNEQKKQRVLPDLPEGTYLIHVYLQGRLDSADFELKLKFARGTLAWKSDFPNQVAYVDELAVVPPLDDTPAVRPPPGKPRPPGPRPPKPPPDAPPSGKQAMFADITDVQPEGDGSKLVIGGGTSDGLGDGMKGSVSGIKNGSFTLKGCNANRCFASVKAAPDDVRSANGVVVRP